MKAKIPSRFHILLPEFRLYPPFKEKMLADFERRRPKLVVFRRNFSIRFADPGEANRFFVEFLEKYYRPVWQWREDGWCWRSQVAPESGAAELAGDFYLLKEGGREMLAKMEEEGMVERVRCEE